jgi:hypothetical protein
MKLIIDCETGEQKEVPLTASEQAALEAEQEQIAIERAVAESAALALVELKASARAKLVAGEPLTEEEAATIVL